ncbi:AraC family transcriptional regulator [Croceitalea dokdonensis]|nr:helix-turn-helix domain-containing protein [Croceitalea dokdonensis]
MFLSYLNELDKGSFHIADFCCKDSLPLLKKKGYYKFMWALDNDVRLNVDGYDLILNKGQLIFCTPSDKVTMEIGQTGCISYVFNREFYCIRDHDYEVSCYGLLFYGSSQPRVISLNEKDSNSYIMMNQIMIEEFITKDHVQGEMLRVVLKRMLIKSTRLARNTMPNPELPDFKVDLIRRFNVLVDDNFKEKHQVSEYAKMLNKSPKTLSSLFKKYSDKTALTFINERILLEAKRLLLYSDKTSEEISYELGYKESGHFSKFFKNQVGKTPIEFRKAARSKAE